MNNKSLAAVDFTCDVLDNYIKFYVSFVVTKNTNVEFVNGPQLDPNYWWTFVIDRVHMLEFKQQHY